MTAVKSEVSNSTGGTPVPRVIIQTIDQCECTGCESVIPHQNIVAKIDKKTGVRTVRAYCEHCNIGFLINQVLRDGDWKIVGMVAVLDHREKARLLRETDERFKRRPPKSGEKPSGWTVCLIDVSKRTRRRQVLITQNERRTSNIQRPTLNVRILLRRWKFDVGRSTFAFNLRDS
jgi:Pyruvate/2-oxoacid:ferredoxin oxidoreductase delta subunit